MQTRNIFRYNYVPIIIHITIVARIIHNRTLIYSPFAFCGILHLDVIRSATLPNNNLGIPQLLYKLVQVKIN